MFGLGWSEMLVIGIVALIVIGPKDLPGLFRSIGQFTGKARMMAREFSRAMEQAANESGVKDVSNTLKAAANPQQFGVDKIKEAAGATKGPATQALSAERQAQKEKLSEAMANAAIERKAREAEDAAIAAGAPPPPPPPKIPKAEE
ncbi:Sec-independent protein translocase protein TatB [Cognatiyoonia sp. IB215446]|uniref:Sec-independent protein translocase protein TatB n=1 Tax=Cognatiyoonia sp. IB215446 TaxID=3097355 RepID=UPI002A11A6E5|nr:Sec-independent protein translocase protein TatB [Cognatiyoonia sp. IB215446]MDX8348487.1 Sec-independent protein translocase protein TatB [Cognatiyoonia sp. IB215446]